MGSICQLRSDLEWGTTALFAHMSFGIAIGLRLLGSHGPVHVTEKNKIYDSYHKHCNLWKKCHH